MNILRLAGLAWAEAVMEGSFFIMQLYLTNVWKMSFTNAAGFLNIWGGIYRILPIFFLFLADTFFGNFITLTFSAISSTTGAVLVTLATAPVLGKSVSGGACEEKGEGASCVGHTEKALFISGMAFIALGRAARVAAIEPFMNDQTIINSSSSSSSSSCNPIRSCIIFIASVIFLITPLGVIIAFPYVKRWDVLFGVSAACTAIATLFYLSGIHTYTRCGPNKNGSPITDIFRVIVAAALKRSQPLIPQENIQLHRIDDQEEFKDFSASRTLRFLHKAAIVLAGDDVEVKKPWKLCSVSQVESAKTIIRMVPIWCAFTMCGVVSSAGNTYFVEQASHMNPKLGSSKLPIQFLLLGFVVSKYMIAPFTSCIVLLGKSGAISSGLMGALSSVFCCMAAAAVERRRLHVVRRHHLLDTPDDAIIPMSIIWILFQVALLANVDLFSQCGISAFHLSETPKSMKRYEECFSEAVAGFGFICSALSVYVVGKISNNWFQYTLNRSRLDRYYWVLSVLTALNLIAFHLIVRNYSFKEKKESVNEIEENAKRAGPELFGIKKSSALGLIYTYISKLNQQNPTHITNRVPIQYLKLKTKVQSVAPKIFKFGSNVQII